jgi:hypothetical protein
MKIIKPIEVNDTIFQSSNVPENDYAEWSGGTTYALGAKVIVLSTHAIYESAGGGNTGNDPTTDTVNWFTTGATNRWKAFDKKISDPVTNTTSITYNLQDAASSVTAIAFFGLVGTSVNVTVTTSAGAEVYNVTKSLVETDGVLDWYSYFFLESTTNKEAQFLSIPPYLNADVAITITTTTGETAKVGQIVLGYLTSFGLTTYGTSLSIEDYSSKEVDAFGNFIITERAFSNIADFNIKFLTSDARRIQNTLATFRAKPLVFIGSNDTSYGLTLYGFYKRFDLTLETPSYSFGSVEIEGLT